MQTPLAIFGLGISNLAVIKALIARGQPVIAWDDNESACAKAEALGAEVKNLTIDTLANCAALILAPGVPLNHPVPAAARKAGVDILCDIELRARQGWSCKTVGITGTNGKSTTTALIGHILKSSGIQTAIGGNIGTPIFDLDIPGESGVLVLELSSYQIDLCPTFRPDIAVLLNITPDHLDRHGTIERYAAAKACMFEGPGAAVITGADEYSQNVQTPRIRLDVPQELKEQPALRGAHNIQNMQAAYAVCTHLGLSHEQIIEGFRTFPGLPHRQYKVRTIGQIDYINDSKATNAEAAGKALASFENIYWIAGGLPKEGGLAGLETLLPRVKKAYLIGQAQDEFGATLSAHAVPFECSGTMKTATQTAHKDAQAAGQAATVLLSPAAASFDQYKNFEERGNDFAHLVEALDD